MQENPKEIQRYLEECIESIINQSYKNLEIFLVDDGSTDSSGEIIRKYTNSDKRIKSIFQKNSGVSTARNSAIAKATGEYLCLIDQDDIILPKYISFLVNIILASGAEIALLPQALRFKGTATKLLLNNASKNTSFQIWDSKKAIKENLYYKVIVSPWSKMISMDLIKSYNIYFDSRFFSGEGFLWSLETYKHAKTIVVSQNKLYGYRCDNPNSGMTKFKKTIIDSTLEAQKVINNKFSYISKSVAKACKYANWHSHCDCLNYMVGCKVVNEYRELYKQLYKNVRHYALLSVICPISFKEKIKGICYFISPTITAIIINKLRVRKFTIENS